MGIAIIIFVVLAFGISFGFITCVLRTLAKQGLLPRPKRPAVAWFLMGSACICLVVALGAAFYSWHFVGTAERTTGTIIEMREQRDKENGGTLYAPTFSFRDASGVQHIVASNVWSAPPQHRVGDTVAVLYQPTDPQGARMNGYWHLWGLPTITGLLGGIYLPIGLVLLFWPRIIGRYAA
jgi:hypothetical protein